MDSSSLADKLIEKIDNGLTDRVVTPFSVGQAPYILLEKHPSVYRFRGELYCEHDIIKIGDINRLYELIDMPDASITKPQAIWIYNRVYEMAREFDSRYLLVNASYVWDTYTSQMIPVEQFDEIAVTTDKTTKRIRSYNECIR